MRFSLAPAMLATSLWAVICLLQVSCGSLQHKTAPAVPAPRAVSPSPHVHRIAQLHYGANAIYGLCIEPACPTLTPKTLAREDAHPAATVEGTIEPDILALHSVGASTEKGSVTGAESPEVTRLTVYFEPGSSRLNTAAQHELKQFLTLVQPGARIHIAGRTDNVGTLVLNHSIARQRAARVENYLRHHIHVPAIQYAVESGGACCYAADNASTAGRQNNRRVDLSLTSNEPMQALQ